MAKKQIEAKATIERNREKIEKLLSGVQNCKRINNMNWIPRQMMIEAETLIQFPKDMPKIECESYIDNTSIINLPKAWQYVLENTDKIIDYMEIRQIHKILTADTDIPGGVYRLDDAFIERLQIHAPAHNAIFQKIDDIQYHISDTRIHPLNRAINVHFDLIATQPFNDFNKRTARVIMNWILLQNGYRPILFNQRSDKNDYMAALLANANGKHKKYIQYMYKCMIRTQEAILTQLTKSRI